MHHNNFQKRIRLTFVDDYFDEKWEEKVIFLCIIHRNKTKFLNDCSPPQWSSYSLCITLCLLNIHNISKGHIGSLGGTMLYLGFIVLERGWLYSSCHTTILISLQNVMEKIINYIITLSLFNILKLLCSYFLFIYLIFLHQRVYWMVWWVTFESNCI